MKRFTIYAPRVTTLVILASCLILCIMVPEFRPGILGLPFFALALSRDRLRQNVRGGGLAKLREIYPTPSDTFLDLGYLNGTDLTDDHNMIEITDEAGNFIDTLSGSQKAMMKTVLTQSSIDEVLLRKNARAKYYDLYYSVLLANGNTQEVSAGIVKIKAGGNLEFKSGTLRGIELEIYFLAPKGDFTRTPVDYNIVAPAPYVIIENAVAKGLPSDTATNLKTAVL